MTPDEKFESYNKGFQAGKEHAEPSPATQKFIGILQTEMQNTKDEIKEIKVSITKLPTKSEVEVIIRDAMIEVLKETNCRYASKNTEKIVYGVVIALIIYILQGFIKFVN